MMKGILKSVIATAVLLAAFSVAAMAGGTHNGTKDNGLGGGAVVAGIFAVIAFFVIFSNTKRTA